MDPLGRYNGDGAAEARAAFGGLAFVNREPKRIPRPRRNAPAGAGLPRGALRFAAAVLLSLAATLGAAEPKRLLFSDGAFRPCEILLVRDNGLDVRLDGKVLFLAWDKLDSGQGLALRAARLEQVPGSPPVRARFDLARDCLAQGFSELGRRQIRSIAREHPLLAEAAGIWLEDFPESAPAAALADGVDALLAGRWDEVYAPLVKAAEAAPGSPEQEAARRYLKIFIESGGRVPAGTADDKADPSVASQVRVVQGRLNTAWARTEEAERYYREGRVTDMRRAFDQAEALLERTASDGAALARHLPAGPLRTEASDLKARAERDLLGLHLKRAERCLDLRLWTEADDAISKVETAEPANESAKILRERLNKLWRKKPS
jgi:hypothetical protein